MIQRGDDRDVRRAGAADLETKRVIQADDHMRPASASKAYVGAAILALVNDGTMTLGETIRERRPDLPAAWSPVTVAQLLQHTSGLPDYSASHAFRAWLPTNLRTRSSPAR